MFWKKEKERTIPNQAFVWTTGPIRLRQGGSKQILFTKHSRCECFVNKKKEYHAAAGDIPRQTGDYLIHVSIGRFAFFARFVVFVVQTPTA